VKPYQHKSIFVEMITSDGQTDGETRPYLRPRLPELTGGKNTKMGCINYIVNFLTTFY